MLSFGFEGDDDIGWTILTIPIKSTKMSIFIVSRVTVKNLMWIFKLFEG